MVGKVLHSPLRLLASASWACSCSARVSAVDFRLYWVYGSDQRPDDEEDGFEEENVSCERDFPVARWTCGFENGSFL